MGHRYMFSTNGSTDTLALQITEHWHTANCELQKTSTCHVTGQLPETSSTTVSIRLKPPTFGIFMISYSTTPPVFIFLFLSASKYLLELSVSIFSRTASVDSEAKLNVRGFSTMGGLFRRAGTASCYFFHGVSWWALTRGTHFLLSFKG